MFKEAATCRSKMKDYCWKMFLQYYGDALGLNDDHEGQLAHYQNISYNVTQLIGKASKFHYGPVDSFVSYFYSKFQSFWLLDQGKKTNLTHPCIGALCVQFYYGSAGGKYPLAKAFPEDFRTSIPEHAVAVAMTTVNTSVTLFAKLTILFRSTIALTSTETVNTPRKPSVARTIITLMRRLYGSFRWSMAVPITSESGIKPVNNGPSRECESWCPV